MDQPTTAVDPADVSLELGLQELEPIEAPGFFTGMLQGGVIVSTITAIGATTIT